MLEVDRRSLRLIRQFPVGPSIGDFAVGKNAVWMVNTASSTLLRVDPNYGRIVDRIPLPRSAKPGIGAISSAGVALGAGSVWVAHGLAHVERVDPATGRIEHSFSFDDASAVAFGDGAVWVVASDLGTVTKIDPATNEVVARARIPPWICCPAVGGGYFWASNGERIWKVSRTGEVVATYEAPSQTGNIAFGDGALWVANDAAGSVLQIDPETDAVKTYRLGHFLTGIGASGHVVAVSVRPTGADVLAGVTGKVLEIRMGQDWIGSADPAVGAAPGTNEWPWLQQLFHATCAGLLSYPDAPGQRGWRLVPEVAAALPSVSRDGRTYTFAVRRGFRFSPPSNQPVTAETFKYSIERALSPKLGSNAPALTVASDIAGVQAYRAGRAKHVAGITARRNVLRITLRHPLADFPERIAFSYFCPVPIGTPAVPNGLQDSPLPSAGPYYLRGFGGDVAVLKRNPSYHGSRPHHLDAIVYRGQPQTGAGAAAVARGKADYIAEPAAALAPTTALARRFGVSGPRRRYFRMPLLATDELAFDTRHGPFVDARVRRAVNFALDRPRLSAVLGDLVADRYLPPASLATATAASTRAQARICSMRER